jgi:nucleoside-diphosphate-sugar epimerase
MAIQTVAVTGGNGRIGGRIINELNAQGYRTANLNRGKQQSRVVGDDHGSADEYVQTQMLDPGKVYGSLAKCDAEAVVHMASIPNPMTHVGYETFESNVMSTYYVLEAASQLELEAAVVLSSVNVIGGPFQETPIEIEYLPVDEEHPVTPRDPYATSKHVIEVMADAFGRQTQPPTRIASLRYPWVATTEELQTTFEETDRTLPAVAQKSADIAREDLFSYIHINDAGTIVPAILESDFVGHERFWAVASDTTSSVPTSEIIDACYPDVKEKREFDGRESIISIRKAHDLLGWEPRKTWK